MKEIMIVLGCVLVVIGFLVALTKLLSFSVNRKKHQLAIKFSKALLSPEKKLPEVFKILERFNLNDFNDESLIAAFLKNDLRQRFKNEISSLEGFKLAYQLVFDLPSYLHKPVYREFISACLTKNSEHWANLYALAGQDDFSSIFFIDQIVSNYETKERIEIYEEASEKIALCLMIHFEDSPLTETKQGLQDLVSEFRNLIWDLKKKI